MPIQRRHVIGAPHIYYLHARCALGQALLATAAEQQAMRSLLELLRRCFDLRVYAYAIEGDAYHLVLRHADRLVESDERLSQRWSLLGGRHGPPPERLRRRFTTLDGLMQTLAQRFSHDFHRRNGGRGSIWAGRYRACLLADDAALLAAVAWVEHGLGPKLPSCASSFAQRRRAVLEPPQLARLPLRITPGGEVVPSDEAILNLPPPAAADEPSLLDRFVATLDSNAVAGYGEALARAWTLGRPESLTEALARLGRHSGRGRSRSLRELDDELGLCGVWG